jgi:hypothetical protein
LQRNFGASTGVKIAVPSARHPLRRLKGIPRALRRWQNERLPRQ